MFVQDDDFQRTRDLRKSPEGRAILLERNPDDKFVKSFVKSQRPFIGWDGEGINYSPDAPQSYVLFGCSTGEYIKAREGETLSTIECLDLLLDVAENHREHIHVGFAFTYDVNMILADVPLGLLRKLHKENSVRYLGYYIEFIPGKMFRVRKGKRRITLYDTFSFFQCSFVKALRQYLGDIPELSGLQTGKDARGAFRYSDIEISGGIREYWESELRLLVILMDRLRENLNGAGIQVSKWHGPGAIADSLFKKHGIKSHITREQPSAVREAAQHAYAGGRFEQFYCGKYDGRVYQYDIRSAYPFAITGLPSLNGGEWHYENHGEYGKYKKVSEIVDFALYEIKYGDCLGIDTDEYYRKPRPFFYRTPQNVILYPNRSHNWVWGIELKAALTHYNPHSPWQKREFITVLQEWVYRDNGQRPFEFVAEMYKQRAKWKREGNGAQLAAKLGMNSLYGKTAQTVGWNEEKRLPPPWHQLEYGGYITAVCRSMIWHAINQAPDQIISVETDGIFSMVPLDLPIGEELGQWEESIYDGIISVQNGVYFVKQNGDWTRDGKVRGFDKGTVTVDDALSSVGNLSPLVGTNTRFFTYTAAHFNSEKWRRWETKEMVSKWGGTGKRIHNPDRCGCDNGDWHRTCINVPNRKLPIRGISTKKHLPWLDPPLTEDQFDENKITEELGISTEEW